MLILVLFLMSQEVPAPQVDPAPPASDPAAWLDPVHGTFTMRYRYRSTPTDSDSYLYEFLTFSYGDLAKDPVTAVLSVRFAEDLDGIQHINGYYPFTTIDESYRSPDTQTLYNAYLQVRPVDTGWTVRGGRQTLDDLPEAVLMDGGWARYQAGSHVQVSVFGGIPDNPYESSPQGDYMYGATAQYVPDPALPGKYRIEYMHIRDENVFGLHNDNLTGFTIDEGIGTYRAYARYTMLEGKSRDLVGRLTANEPEAGFLVDLQGTYVFHQIEALAYAIDPFASFMMNLEPYVDLLARASKSFGEIFAVDASFSSRRLVRGAVESTYNHDFNHADVTPKLIGWPIPNVTLSASADWWDSSGEKFWTAGGDISWTLHRNVVISFDSSYSIYSIDAFTGEEHDRVRTFTGQLRWKVAKPSTVEVRFTYEDNSIDRFRIVEFGFRHAF